MGKEGCFFDSAIVKLISFSAQPINSKFRQFSKKYQLAINTLDKQTKYS